MGYAEREQVGHALEVEAAARGQPDPPEDPGLEPLTATQASVGTPRVNEISSPCASRVPGDLAT